MSVVGKSKTDERETSHEVRLASRLSVAVRRRPLGVRGLDRARRVSQPGSGKLVTLAERVQVPRLRERAHRLVNDLTYYARFCLKIKPKGPGGLVKFLLNDVQEFVHSELEFQLRETGRVRAIIVKCRQPGISTYVGGRFYHKITNIKGVSGYILTHRQEATDNLFNMYKRFHEHVPSAIQLPTKSSNAKELKFDGMDDSGIQVATAGSKGAGRSGTIQFFHGSEVAHWTDASDHMAGLREAVPDADGTEVILESTAAGVSGVFYDLHVAIQKGESEYIEIFVPWFMHSEYSTPSRGWRAAGEFLEYQRMYSLTDDQAYWMYRKNRELAITNKLAINEICWVFRQEYPANAAEAFQNAKSNSFLRPELVLRARKANYRDQTDFPLILGVDIAHGGKAATRIVDRRGRCAGHLVDECLRTRDTMEIVGRVSRLIMQHDPDAVFVDCSGNPSVYDRLRELGYRQVHAVMFGGSPFDERYANKRAEMAGLCAEWLEEGADIPDKDEWQSELCATNRAPDDSLSRIKLEPKEQVVERTGLTLDLFDALLTTFAQPVQRRNLPTALRPTRAPRASYRPQRAWQGRS